MKRARSIEYPNWLRHGNTDISKEKFDRALDLIAKRYRGDKFYTLAFLALLAPLSIPVVIALLPMDGDITGPRTQRKMREYMPKLNDKYKDLGMSFRFIADVDSSQVVIDVEARLLGQLFKA
jgi:hypothetical protein